MLYSSLFLIMIVCYLTAIAKQWQDPHEMNFDSGSSEIHCQKQNQELGVLTYYKRSLKILTKHLARNKRDERMYDFNLQINADDYDELINAINDVDHDIEKLKRLDAVLTLVYGKTFMQDMQDVVLTWGEFFKMNLFTKEMGVLSFTLMLPIIIYFYKRSSRQTIVLIVLFVIWAVDFLLTWFNKYEDLEVDNMVEMNRYASSEPTCDLTKLWFYEKWFSSLSATEECKRFYNAKYKNKNYQIGPYDVVIEQVGKVMTIFRFIAQESSKFLSLLTIDIPWPLNWIVIVLVVIMGFYIAQLLLFLLFGYSFKLNFAHLFQFEIRNDQHPRPNRELVQEVRQLSTRIIEAIKEAPIQRNQRNVENQPTNVPAATNDAIIPNKSTHFDGRIDQAISVPNLNSPEVICAQNQTNQPTISNQNEDLLKHLPKVKNEPNELDKTLTEHRQDIIIEEDNKADDSSSESIEPCEELNKNVDSDTDFEFVTHKNDGSMIFAQID